jgi:spore coat polysaccharide biosynthesis protein SpsF
MKIAAIIQARMTSTRLPGKVLMLLEAQPVLWHIIQRVQASKFIDEIIVATTTNKEDDPIIYLANKLCLKSYRGSETDVLDRYYQASKAFGVDVVVRVTADDPLKDPEVIDSVTQAFLEDADLDYASNTIAPTFPEGIDIEVFSFRALRRAWHEATSTFDREHVTAYIWSNPQLFKLRNVANLLGDLSNLRWTLDTPEDFAFIKAVYRKLYHPNMVFHMNDVLELLQANPEIAILNRNVERRACLKHQNHVKVKA